MMTTSILGLQLSVDPRLQWGRQLLYLLSDVIAQSSLAGPLAGELSIERGRLPRYALELERGVGWTGTGVADKRYHTLVSVPARDRIVLAVDRGCPEWFSWCMQLSALREDTTFVHAAGLEKEGAALLLAAPAGFGKTALAADFVRRGYRLLGDDVTLLGRDGSCTGFPRALVLHPGHARAFPELFAERAGPGAPRPLSRVLDLGGRRIKPLLRHAYLLDSARRHHPASVRVLPSRAFGANRLASAATLGTVVWLQRDPRAARAELRPADDIMPARAFSNTISEYDAHCIHVTRVAHSAERFPLGEVGDRWLDILCAGLRHAHCLIFSLPPTLPLERVADTLLELLPCHAAELTQHATTCV